MVGPTVAGDLVWPWPFHCACCHVCTHFAVLSPVFAVLVFTCYHQIVAPQMFLPLTLTYCTIFFCVCVCVSLSFPLQLWRLPLEDHLQQTQQLVLPSPLLPASRGSKQMTENLDKCWPDQKLVFKGHLPTGFLILKEGWNICTYISEFAELWETNPPGKGKNQ